jgi:malate synthase
LKPFFKISYYHDFISPRLAQKLIDESQSVDGIEGLRQVGPGGGLEDINSLKFLIELYKSIESDLSQVLEQRIVDRKFIDDRVKAFSEFNQKMGREISDPDYQTILGLEDGKGRVVIGPLNSNYCRSGGKPIAPIPDFLKGPHVTLFGPPDSAKMSINAMNSYHRKLKDEPEIVGKLLAARDIVPMWGADDEDSKTPLRRDLIDSGSNLTKCFKRTIQLAGDPKYQLAKDHLAIPIKRFPGLALPSSFLFYNSNPLPLHLYDFALHLFHNWDNPQALVFYVPKLENEEEAKYIHKMVSTAERMIHAQHPTYQLGSVRLMVVLENPRAILRTHEIIDALYPYFVGASLGWHDYLGSTARLFKEDSHYRIPVKADPDIVIKYIKASHLLLAEVIGSRGGVKVGGMYGILPQDGQLDSASFQITLLGFIKDVLTQMKRQLTGFWVAHPDFVRLGIALVEAWRQHDEGQKEPLLELVMSLLLPQYHQEIVEFINAKDVEGLNPDDPNYVRSLIVADIKESDFIANNHPEEIRYNVFQALQYLTDWLAGNGCVALPANIRGVPVRVMDDLATAERSRWEVWHEIYHGRFSKSDFVKIAHEELNFIRKNLSNDKKIVQVQWNEETSRWYPIALKLMLKLMTDSQPAEFATELLWPFTVESIRNAKDPWQAAIEVDGTKFTLDPEIKRLNYYFEVCGSKRFAETMAKRQFLDWAPAEELIRSFSLSEIKEAAAFHGDIGESKKGLDSQAASEQGQVLTDQSLLQDLGHDYLKKFGFKFLISAKGKSGSELLVALKERLTRSFEQELAEARTALWEITLKRFLANPLDTVQNDIERLVKKHQMPGVSLAVNGFNFTQTLCFGEASVGQTPVSEKIAFQIASLSKPLASCFALDYFRRHKISLKTSVDSLLEKLQSPFRIGDDRVTLKHLLEHSALNLHYVNGFSGVAPKAEEILLNPKAFGYQPLTVLGNPGETFNYSGGGFLVLETLLEKLIGSSFKNSFFEFSKISETSSKAIGYIDGKPQSLEFPIFAAGVWAQPQEIAHFLLSLAKAHRHLDGDLQISHDTAVEMLFGKDLGSQKFMLAQMGLGIFVIEAGENKWAVHQGANDGFRALCMQCFSGTDFGKGFVICVNEDNKAVSFITEVAQILLKEMKVSGVDFKKIKSGFDSSQLEQEQIVNLGFKQLLFSAFEPCLPPPTRHNKNLLPFSDFNCLIGAKIVSVSNQKFARAENLISEYEPLFDPELFCPQGKVMDSWETVRHNLADYEELILELKAPSSFAYSSISTKYHDGNQIQFVAIDGRVSSSDSWAEILPKIQLQGHSEVKLQLDSREVFSQIRVKAFPDGGLTRLALYSNLPETEKKSFAPVPNANHHRFTEVIAKSKKPLSIPYEPTSAEIERNIQKQSKVDWASSANGGQVLKVSNEHYGPAAQVISPFRPLHMFDGFESARSRSEKHFEEIEIKLGRSCQVRKIIFNFQFFVNNNPQSISVFGKMDSAWVPLIEGIDVKAFAGNQKEVLIESTEKFSELKIKVFPDGGIHRIEVYGS